MDYSEQPAQVMLKMVWRNQLEQKLPLPSFEEVQFRVHSQNGEDGILLYVFTLLGTTNKKFVEICAGSGLECNTANLAINHGWNGLMLDGDPKNIARGKAAYSKHPDTRIWPPTLVEAWITCDNVNDIIRSHGIAGEIDLLSLDIDGNDYWIFEALDVIQPRVIIAEYAHIWGPEKAITQRYKQDAIWDESWETAKRPGLPTCGASLPALNKLAKRKGYRLVGCEGHCVNAIFIRNGLGEDIFPEVEVSKCFSHPMVEYSIGAFKNRHHEIDASFWQEV